jgi:hypothetical protein
MSFPDNEPSLTGGIIVAIAAALLGVLVSFGASITPDQQKAIMVLVTVLAPLVAAVVIRQFVVPVAKLKDAYGSTAAQRLAEGKSVIQ